MAVEAAEFTGVGGLLNTKALWPRVSKTEVTAKFAAWLTDAAAKVTDFTAETKDTATRAWVRFRAWDDVYQVRLGNPASLSVDSRGSHGYTQGQIDAAMHERDAALAAFAVVQGAQVVATSPSTPRGSASVPILFRF